MRKTISLIALLLTMCLLLTACGGFTSWGDTEEKIIEKIYGVKKDGIDYMAIKYVDITEPDLIPMPEGIEGTSVDLFPHYDKNTGKTTVEVTFSNGADSKFFVISDGQSITKASIEPLLGKDYVVFWCGTKEVGSFPLDDIKGKDGATWLTGITAPDNAQGKNGDFFLNTAEFDVYIKKADKWEPVGNLSGVGIDKIAPYESSDGNGIIITYSDPNLDDTIVLCPGIVDIDFNLSKDKKGYVFTVTLSNGVVDANGTTQTTTRDFPVTRLPGWDSGINYPSNEDDGIDGDFYFYEPTKTILYKKNGSWQTIFSFDELLNQDSKSVTVTFNALGGKMTIPGYTNPREEFELSVSQNSFVNASSIPIPTKDGYTFGGWYTVPNPNPLINGLFTDMVPVTQSIFLYAYWIPNTPQQ